MNKDDEGLRLLTDAELDVVAGGANPGTGCDQVTKLSDAGIIPTKDALHACVNPSLPI